MRKTILVLLAFLISSSWASDICQPKTFDASPIYFSYFDANRLYFSCQSNGVLGRHPITGNADFKFDEFEVIYTAGLIIGAKVNGEILTSVSHYESDFIGGIIDSQGNPVVQTDSTFRVYKIAWGDDELTNPDYASWPSQFGAPTDDSGKPVFLGDQMLWCSYIDSYQENRRQNICPPLNAEIHQSVWGYKELDNVVLLRFEIINKGNSVWQDAYFGFFSDPDITNASNDLTGSDSTKQLVYCYDADKFQAGFPFQAVGFTLLESPIVESLDDTADTIYGKKIGYRNVPVTAPQMEKMLDWGDFFIQASNTSRQIYNRLQCLDFNGEPSIDPTTGQATKWSYCGDPITGIGWVDSIPRDRRIMLSAGPLNVAAGDTCALTLAINVVRGAQPNKCIDGVRQEASALQQMFRKQVGLYSEIVYADFGQRDAAIPIKAMNWAPVKKVEFDCQLLPDSVFLKNGIPGVRASEANFIAQADTLTNTVHVSISFDNNPLAVGKGELAEILFDAPQTAADSAVAFTVKNIAYWDSSGQQISLVKFDGRIEFRDFPASATLLSPADGQFIEGVKVDFSWGKPEYSDSLTFGLQLIGDPMPRILTKDTTATMSMIDFLLNDKFNDGNVAWTVNIQNLEREIPATDTFQINFKSKDELRFATYRNQWDFSGGEERESVSILQVTNDTLFINHRHYEPDWSHILILKQEGSGYRILHEQNFDTPIWGSGFRRSGNKIFWWKNSGYWNDPKKRIYLYLMDNNPQFTLADSIDISGNPLGYTPVKDKYLYVFSENEISILKINDQNRFESVKKVSLTDWQWESEYHSPRLSYRVVEDKLLIAYGDWGIFDISDPENPQLLKKLQINGNAYRLAYDAERLFVLTIENYLFGYNVANFEAPELIFAEFLGKGTGEVLGSFYEDYMNLLAHDGLIYILGSKNAQWWEDFALVCHYDEASDRLVMDGFQLFSRDTRVTKDWIYAIHDFTKIDIYQNKILTDVQESIPIARLHFQLHQNFPNPFNSNTVIRFTVPEAQKVSLKIYAITGQEVSTLLNKKLAPGVYSAEWNGKNNSGQTVPTGVYFARLMTGEKSRIIKMVLLK